MKQHRVTVAAVAVLVFGAPAFAGPPVMAGYSKWYNTKPRYNLWTGTWSAMQQAPSFGCDPRWLVMATCPTRPETAMISLDWNRDINVCFYDGTSWGAVTEVCKDTAQSAERCMDSAYESVSGDLLFAYWNKKAKAIGARTYNGTALSAEIPLALPSTATAHYIRLVAKPGSDQIMLLVLNDDERLYAVPWNGSAFGAVTTLETDCETDDEECFSFAYSSKSGQGLVVYGEEDESKPRYRTWNGSAWSAEQQMPSIGDSPIWVRLAACPVSDEIAFGALDDSKYVSFNIWSGSSWGTNIKSANKTAHTNRRQFDVSYGPAGTTAVAIYSESGVSTLRYRTWNAGAWSPVQTAPSLGQQIHFVALYPGSSGSEVFGLASDYAWRLHAFRWISTGVTASTILENDVGGDQTTEPFYLTGTSLGTTQPPRVVRWQETSPN